MKKRISFILCILFLATIKTIAQVIYVDADATGANNGTSWSDAFIYLQDALDIAATGDDIWVAEGIYYPDEDKDADHINNDKTETFQMIEGVDIYGGYPNGGGTRDVSSFITILSGDLDQSTTKNSNDALHVVNGANSAKIDGLTITGGYARGTSYNDYMGGGMLNYGVHPTIIGCTFTDNRAVLNGGAIFNTNSSPTISNCLFFYNQADGNGGGIANYDNSGCSIINTIFEDNNASIHGGGMHIQINGGYPVNFINCYFNENTSSADGGAVSLGGGDITFNKCTFSDNQGRDGGAISSYACNPTFTNCVFINNNSTGTYGGGGIYAYAANPEIKHCTFYNNIASNAGDGLLKSSASPTITNTIFWGSDNQIVSWGTGVLSVTYSNVQQASGIFSGIGNINDDPSFVSSADLHLTSSSYCLGVGTDLGLLEDRDGNLRPRPVGTNPDMGAYEYAPIILPDLTVFLEGPYSGGQLTTTLKSDLPLAQPFNLAPWNYGGKESISSIPENITDWILLELRSDSQSSSMIIRKAAFLKNDGLVVETDGSSSISFDDLASGDYYVVVYHRNHLPIMSSAKILVE